MKLSNQVKNFIIDNQALIERNEFDELYQKAIFDLESVVDLSAVLVKSGIDPLPYIGNMTSSMMFSHLDISNICKDYVLYIPKNIESIGANCFERATGFNQVNFTANLKYINDYAFYDTQITELDVPGSVKIIAKGAFSLCNKLKTVKLNEGVEELESMCFSGCEMIHDISLPDSLRAIGEKVITGWNTEIIRIPKNVTYIGRRNFNFMSGKLEEVHFDMTFDGFKSIIMEALIPEGVKVIFRDKRIISDGNRIK